MIKKIIISFVLLLRTILPSIILLTAIRVIGRYGKVGKWVVKIFDPGYIRKLINYKFKQKILTIRSENWKLNVNINDHIGYISFIKNAPFEMAIYKLCELISSSRRSLIIDIGANIGSASIPICKKIDRNLICVEASKSNSRLLFQNILENNIKAMVFPFAMVDVIPGNKKFIDFYINNGNTGANSLLESWNPSLSDGIRDIEYCPMITLDNLINFGSIEIDDVLMVKIDVEGAEDLVLMGGYEFLKKNTAPILLEYRIDIVKNYLNKDMSNVLSILKKFQYEIYSLSEDYKLCNFDVDLKSDNILALKRGSFADLILRRV